MIRPVIGPAQGAVGLGVEAEEDAGIHGKGKTIVPGGIAQEKRDVEVGEIAGQEAVEGIYILDVIDIYPLVLQAAGDGPMIFEDHGHAGASAVGKADGLPGKIFGGAEQVDVKGNMCTGSWGRYYELVWAFGVWRFGCHDCGGL